LRQVKDCLLHHLTIARPQEAHIVKTIVIQGQPDPSGNRLCHALAAAYVECARAVGHKVQYFDAAQLNFPLLRAQEDWQQGITVTPRSLREAQAACAVAQTAKLVLIYPLWLGTLPALVYRWFIFPHGLRNHERNTLGAAGIDPIRRSLFEMVDGAQEKTRLKCIDTMRSLGTRARLGNIQKDDICQYPNR